MPCRRATSVGEAPGARLSAAIDCFCSTDHRRLGSARVTNSMPGLRPLLNALVRALAVSASGSVTRAALSMTQDQHIRARLHHVGLSQRLLGCCRCWSSNDRTATGYADLAG